MPTYLYGPNAALNIETGLLLGNTVGRVYASSDTGYTSPLQIIDMNGISGIEVGVFNGVTQPFRVDDHASVVWVDAGSGTPVALDAYGGNVPPGGLAGQVLTKVSDADYDVTWSDASGGSSVQGFSVMSLSAPEPTDPYASLPAGSSLVVSKTGSEWPARPTPRTDIIVFWRGAEPGPPNMLPGDVRLPPSL